MRTAILFSFFIALSPAWAQRKTENLVIVTLDGFRWQELFQGADSSMLFNKKITPDSTIAERFWSTSQAARRSKLLPFFWNTINEQGQLYGNRNLNNKVDCSNPYWFSYPGYSELFAGHVDRRVRSNSKVKNPTSTVFEFINSQTPYEGKVAVFSTWDVIPYVIRAQDAYIPANSGDAEACSSARQEAELFQTRHQHLYQDKFESKDAYTFFLALNFLKAEKPKVLYISLDETDAQAHGGRYGNYLRAAQQADELIAQLWAWLQSDEQYRDKTTLLLTTDHGRGKRSTGSWQRHGRLSGGSGQIWFAAIGPDTPPTGEMATSSRYFQKQFAKTAAGFLGLRYQNTSPVGDEIHTMRIVTELTSR